MGLGIVAPIQRVLHHVLPELPECPTIQTFFILISHLLQVGGRLGIAIMFHTYDYISLFLPTFDMAMSLGNWYSGLSEDARLAA